MERIDVTDKEAVFESDELFFSITRRDSTILSGNDVFTRISGYAEEELVGSFHNIIRHPDMPKIVFKTLWDALNVDKPLVAYVKNRSRDGKYYWVLAAVFPLGEHLISIRIKPDSPLFAAARELYFKLLMSEAKGGMEASAPLLGEALKGLGYDSYAQFMSDALVTELAQRKAKAVESCLNGGKYESSSAALMRLKSIHDTCERLVCEYETWFEKISLFNEVKSIFQEKGTQLRRLARDVVFLSLNASVASYKVESGGETFGVLARDIRNSAKENDEMIGRIDGIIALLSEGLNELVFSISAISLQIETVTYFIEEVLCKNNDEKMGQINTNISDLITLVVRYAHRAHALQSELLENILEVISHLEQIEKQMFYLGYIQVYGVIEAARADQEGGRFGVIFSELKTLLTQTTAEVEAMQKLGLSVEKESRRLLEASSIAEAILEKLRDEGESLMKGAEYA